MKRKSIESALNRGKGIRSWQGQARRPVLATMLLTVLFTWERDLIRNDDFARNDFCFQRFNGC